MHSFVSLADGVRRLRIKPGDIVMLHASVRSVGEVAGDPNAIHFKLKAALTDAGTLMMCAPFCPAFTLRPKLFHAHHGSL